MAGENFFVMRVGTVDLFNNRLWPVVRIYVEGPEWRSTIYEAMIDTGFSEYLALPGEIIDYLRLEPAGSAEARLANGQMQRFPLFHAEVIFGTRVYNLRVHRTDSAALIGMSLLSGNVLKIDARVGGAVEIEPSSEPNT